MSKQQLHADHLTRFPCLDAPRNVHSWSMCVGPTLCVQRVRLGSMWAALGHNACDTLVAVSMLPSLISNESLKAFMLFNEECSKKSLLRENLLKATVKQGLFSH